MEIRIAPMAGFCFGVKRAVDEAESAAKKHHPIYSFGDLIHNPQVVQRLSSAGLRSIDDLSKLSSKDTLIIRSHGAPPSVYEEARKRKATIIDLTCPFVKAAENHGRILRRKGHEVVIIGKPDHPEVIAISGHAQTNHIIPSLQNVEEVVSQLTNIAVISQTTVPPERFEAITSRIRKLHPDAVIINTICDATIERQDAARALAKEVDVMIVIGGHNSSNTQKLSEICREIVATYHVEHAGELDSSWFTHAKTVGITAGASTPDHVIAEVADALSDT